MDHRYFIYFFLSLSNYSPFAHCDTSEAKVSFPRIVPSYFPPGYSVVLFISVLKNSTSGQFSMRFTTTTLRLKCQHAQRIPHNLICRTFHGPERMNHFDYSDHVVSI